MVSPPSRDGRSLHNRRAVKMNLANEGLEARKKEEEVNAKKRKAERTHNGKVSMLCIFAERRI